MTKSERRSRQGYPLFELEKPDGSKILVGPAAVKLVGIIALCLLIAFLAIWGIDVSAVFLHLPWLK
jgi:hypothetical protein